MNLFRLFGRFPRLETKHLTLKALKLRDWKMVFELYNEEKIAKYNPWGKIRTPQQARQKIRQYQAEFHYHQKIRWGIFDKKTNEIMGNCVISSLNLNQKKAEIGFNLYPQYWGKGIIQEVLLKILDFLFRKIELEKIEAWVMAENWRCRKMLERLGFGLEFIIKKSILNQEIPQDFWIISIEREVFLQNFPQSLIFSR